MEKRQGTRWRGKEEGEEEGGDGCGVYSRRVQALRHGGSVWRDEGRGRGVKKKKKKDTKTRRESLNDKRSGQLGLGRWGPKGAAG